MKELQSLEVGSRLIGVFTLREEPPMFEAIIGAVQIYSYYQEKIAVDERHNKDVESLYSIMLNTRNKVIGHYLCSQGTVDSLLVHPREIFRAGIVAGATSIILLHNHPSGDPSPSSADVTFTQQIINAGNIIKMKIIDHVIVTEKERAEGKGYFSLRESGMVCF